LSFGASQSYKAFMTFLGGMIAVGSLTCIEDEEL
jgi:hypothetical protein